MARSKGFYDKETGRVIWVPIEKLQDLQIERRNNPVAPSVIGDAMDPLKSPKGVWCDSKAKWEQQVEKEGFRIRGDEEKAVGHGFFAPDTKEWLKSVEDDLEQATQRAAAALKDGHHKAGESQLIPENRVEHAKHVNELFKSTTGKDPVIKGGI